MCSSDLTFWALSFPLASFASLSMQLAGSDTGVLGAVALLSLALASLTVGFLALATVRGLRDGSLLAPEQVPLHSA